MFSWTLYELLLHMDHWKGTSGLSLAMEKQQLILMNAIPYHSLCDWRNVYFLHQCIINTLYPSVRLDFDSTILYCTVQKVSQWNSV